MTAFEVDHKDPPDKADTHAELAEPERETVEMCDLHDLPEPCPCRVPFSVREERALKAKYAQGPMRYRGVR